MHICVAFACNDYRNGNDLGRAESVNVCYGTAPTIELQGSSKVFRLHNPRVLRVGRRLYPIISFREWYGNWCWNAVCVNRIVASMIVNQLIDAGWHCDGAATDMFEKLNSKKAINPEDFGT